MHLTRKSFLDYNYILTCGLQIIKY